MTVRAVGDTSIVVTFSGGICEETHRRVMAVVGALESHSPEWIEEYIPSYSSVSVVYNPLMVPLTEALQTITRVARGSERHRSSTVHEIVHLPVLYGGQWGVDLPEVARTTGFLPSEVIKIHSQGRYLTYMLGFTPGFLYLGGMDERIATARREVPRQRIPAGAVGIAGAQTGVYPLESPGGWQIIGRTPARLFDPRRDPPVCARAGQYVVFDPVNEEEYRMIEGDVARDVYHPTIERSSSNVEIDGAVCVA